VLLIAIECDWYAQKRVVWYVLMLRRIDIDGNECLRMGKFGWRPQRAFERWQATVEEGAWQHRTLTSGKQWPSELDARTRYIALSIWKIIVPIVMVHLSWRNLRLKGKCSKIPLNSTLESIG
jgi:hypothetical protein